MIQPDEIDEVRRSGFPHLLVDHVDLAVGGVDCLADDVAREPRRLRQSLGLDDAVRLRVAPRRRVHELDLGDEAAVGVLLGLGHEVGEAHAERFGQVRGSRERGLPRVPLDEPDVGLVDAGSLGELVGRQSLSAASVGDETRDDLADIKSVLRHPAPPRYPRQLRQATKPLGF